MGFNSPMGSSVMKFSNLYFPTHLSASCRSRYQSGSQLKSRTMATRPSLRLVQLFEEEKVAFIKKKEQELLEKVKHKKAKWYKVLQRGEVSKEKYVSFEAEVSGIESEFLQLLAQKAILEGPNGEETHAASSGSDSHFKSRTMATIPALRLVQLFLEEKAAFIKKTEQEIYEKLESKMDELDELEKRADSKDEMCVLLSETEQLLAQMATLKQIRPHNNQGLLVIYED